MSCWVPPAREAVPGPRTRRGRGSGRPLGGDEWLGHPRLQQGRQRHGRSALTGWGLPGRSGATVAWQRGETWRTPFLCLLTLRGLGGTPGSALRPRRQVLSPVRNRWRPPTSSNDTITRENSMSRHDPGREGAGPLSWGTRDSVPGSGWPADRGWSQRRKGRALEDPGASTSPAFFGTADPARALPPPHPPTKRRPAHVTPRDASALAVPALTDQEAGEPCQRSRATSSRVPGTLVRAPGTTTRRDGHLIRACARWFKSRTKGLPLPTMRRVGALPPTTVAHRRGRDVRRATRPLRREHRGRGSPVGGRPQAGEPGPKRSCRAADVPTSPVSDCRGCEGTDPPHRRERRPLGPGLEPARAGADEVPVPPRRRPRCHAPVRGAPGTLEEVAQLVDMVRRPPGR